MSALPASPLSGQVAVITGASSGIGRETALTLARAGAAVCLGARRIHLLHEVVKEIEGKGGKALAVQTDVTKRNEVKNLIARAEEALGPVDILINNAGLWYCTTMTGKLDEDDWDTMIDVNCKGVMNAIGAVINGMVARKKGHIVNMSSECGRKGFPGLAVYSGTKFFVEGMSAALRLEVAKHGIKVTNIQPGDVDTPGHAISHDKEAIEKFGAPKGIELMQAVDIAEAVLYAVTQPKRTAVNEVLLSLPEMPF
ncbi:hypothetical protein EGW08_003056 [Elysia chlorotica]|uniref:NADP-dependent 3-hydroxy acid dehydrogenase YdfG n=1 Tax=Elysia chlorotica TaxID=188477 RepID=A0A433U5S6_ELYCH|nr:hypothetical protein EGW08_003056 [Elysia chlorotica]